MHIQYLIPSLKKVKKKAWRSGVTKVAFSWRREGFESILPFLLLV